MNSSSQLPINSNTLSSEQNIIQNQKRHSLCGSDATNLALESTASSSLNAQSNRHSMEILSNTNNQNEESSMCQNNEFNRSLTIRNSCKKVPTISSEATTSNAAQNFPQSSVALPT